jgi:hypothetical protein
MIRYLLILCIGLIFSGCCSDKVSKYPRYKKVVELVNHSNGDISYDTKLTICEFVHSRHNKSKLNTTSIIEFRVIDLVKSEGLYINKLDYVKDIHGDTYIHVEASEKPTFTKDWNEYKKHQELYDLMLLQKKYGIVTNTTLKCECRYCTSGLHHKYWY